MLGIDLSAVGLAPPAPGAGAEGAPDAGNGNIFGGFDLSAIGFSTPGSGDEPQPSATTDPGNIFGGFDLSAIGFSTPGSEDEPQPSATTDPGNIFGGFDLSAIGVPPPKSGDQPQPSATTDLANIFGGFDLSAIGVPPPKSGDKSQPSATTDSAPEEPFNAFGAFGGLGAFDISAMNIPIPGTAPEGNDGSANNAAQPVAEGGESEEAAASSSPLSSPPPPSSPPEFLAQAEGQLEKLGAASTELFADGHLGRHRTADPRSVKYFAHGVVDSPFAGVAETIYHAARDAAQRRRDEYAEEEQEERGLRERQRLAELAALEAERLRAEREAAAEAEHRKAQREAAEAAKASRLRAEAADDRSLLVYKRRLKPQDNVCAAFTLTIEKLTRANFTPAKRLFLCELVADHLQTPAEQVRIAHVTFDHTARAAVKVMVGGHLHPETARARLYLAESFEAPCDFFLGVHFSNPVVLARRSYYPPAEEAKEEPFVNEVATAELSPGVSFRPRQRKWRETRKLRDTTASLKQLKLQSISFRPHRRRWRETKMLRTAPEKVSLRSYNLDALAEHLNGDVRRLRSVAPREVSLEDCRVALQKCRGSFQGALQTIRSKRRTALRWTASRRFRYSQVLEKAAMPLDESLRVSFRVHCKGLIEADGQDSQEAARAIKRNVASNLLHLSQALGIEIDPVVNVSGPLAMVEAPGLIFKISMQHVAGLPLCADISLCIEEGNMLTVDTLGEFEIIGLPYVAAEDADKATEDLDALTQARVKLSQLWVKMSRSLSDDEKLSQNFALAQLMQVDSAECESSLRGACGNDRRSAISLIDLLVVRGTEINAADREFGITPLMCASRGRRPETVELLISEGAQMDTQDKLGRTALHHCLLQKPPDVDIAVVLIKAGCDVSVKDSDGRSALATAVAVECDDVAALIRVRCGVFFRDDIDVVIALTGKDLAFWTALNDMELQRSRMLPSLGQLIVFHINTEKPCGADNLALGQVTAITEEQVEEESEASQDSSEVLTPAVTFRPRWRKWRDTKKLKKELEAEKEKSQCVSFRPRQRKWRETRKIRDSEALLKARSQHVKFRPHWRKWRETKKNRITIEKAKSTVGWNNSPIRIIVRLFEASADDERDSFNVRGAFRSLPSFQMSREIFCHQIVAAFVDFDHSKGLDYFAPGSTLPDCPVTANGANLYEYFEEANSIYAREWNRNSSDIEGSCWAELLAGRNEREAAKQEALRQKKITMKQKKKGRKKRR